MVQMNLTVPHSQKGPALSSFAALRICLEGHKDPALRGGMTGCDGSHCQGLFFTIEPCLNKLKRTSSVGADLSRPSPIDRPPAGRIILSMCIIVPKTQPLRIY